MEKIELSEESMLILEAKPWDESISQWAVCKAL